MNEKPILFKSDMVRAILEGRKTETRRIIKFKDLPLEPLHHNIWKSQSGWQDGDIKIKCPYGQVGDRLWVRETWCADCGKQVCYRENMVRCEQRATHFPNRCHPWHPSIHMFRKYSRITLEITDIKVERVQDITEEGAKAEGIKVLPLQSEKDESAWYQSAPGINQARTAKQSFQKLWDSINKKRGFGWESNPWVWVVKFKRLI